MTLYKAHFSLMIFGFSNTRWVAYAFENNHFNERMENHLEDTHDRRGNDPIVGGGVLQETVRDPREYFLLVIRNRVFQMTKRWEDLVRHLERRLNVCSLSIVSFQLV